MIVRAHKNCIADLPFEMLTGFIDTTYHNDELAIITKPVGIGCALVLYSDYYEVEQREEPDRERFTLFLTVLLNDQGETEQISSDNIILETNDINELFNTIKNYE